MAVFLAAPVPAYSGENQRIDAAATIALQVLTLIEFVSRKELSERQEILSGLVPGNPKMKTPRPTAGDCLPNSIICICLWKKKEKIFQA